MYDNKEECEQWCHNHSQNFYVNRWLKDYIHTRSAPFFDPYTIYWRRKIEKEILYHSRSIDQIREDKLKQLLK